MNYERQENTEWANQRLRILAIEAEEILQRTSYPDLNAIQEYQKTICKWWDDTGGILTSVYKDRDVWKHHCPPIIELELKSEFLKEAHEKLRGQLAITLEGLEYLLSRWDEATATS